MDSPSLDCSGMNLSEKMAQKRKDKVIRNLRSKFLLAIG